MDASATVDAPPAWDAADAAPPDPCAGNADCDPNATCTATGPSTHSCACNAGFTGPGTTCAPVCDATLCGSVCIAAPGSVDQRQLDMPGTVGLSGAQRPGESFTAGTSGILTGIEVAVGPCNHADATGRIQLELFDASGTSLGAVSIAESSLPDTCGGSQLVSAAVGAGYFDLSALCLHVTAGQQLRFVLSLLGGTPSSCDLATNTCTGSGRVCFESQDCVGFYSVGDTNCGGGGCATSPDRYPGGDRVMQSPSSGAISDDPAFELAFKTFVQP